MTDKRSNTNYEILAGHKKIGSKRTLFPNVLKETRYAEFLLPELIWIAVLNKELGMEPTIQVVVSIAKSMERHDDGTENWFLFAENLSKLSEEQIKSVKDDLAAKNLLGKVTDALAAFYFLYPTFPISWLELQPIEKPSYLNEFKSLLAELIDKRSRHSTLMLASAIYGLMVGGMLIVQDDFLINNLESLREYPNTELSQRIAASIRAMSNTLIMSPNYSIDRRWAQHFWQRGLELEAPDFPKLLWGDNE